MTGIYIPWENYVISTLLKTMVNTFWFPVAPSTSYQTTTETYYIYQPATTLTHDVAETLKESIAFNTFTPIQ